MAKIYTVDNFLGLTKDWGTNKFSNYNEYRRSLILNSLIEAGYKEVKISLKDDNVYRDHFNAEYLDGSRWRKMNIKKDFICRVTDIDKELSIDNINFLYIAKNDITDSVYSPAFEKATIENTKDMVNVLKTKYDIMNVLFRWNGFCNCNVNNVLLKAEEYFNKFGTNKYEFRIENDWLRLVSTKNGYVVYDFDKKLYKGDYISFLPDKDEPYMSSINIIRKDFSKVEHIYVNDLMFTDEVFDNQISEYNYPYTFSDRFDFHNYLTHNKVDDIKFDKEITPDGSLIFHKKTNFDHIKGINEYASYVIPNKKKYGCYKFLHIKSMCHKWLIAVTDEEEYSYAIRKFKHNKNNKDSNGMRYIFRIDSFEKFEKICKTVLNEPGWFENKDSCYKVTYKNTDDKNETITVPSKCYFYIRENGNIGWYKCAFDDESLRFEPRDFYKSKELSTVKINDVEIAIPDYVDSNITLGIDKMIEIDNNMNIELKEKEDSDQALSLMLQKDSKYVIERNCLKIKTVSSVNWHVFKIKSIKFN